MMSVKYISSLKVMKIMINECAIIRKCGKLCSIYVIYSVGSHLCGNIKDLSIFFHKLYNVELDVMYVHKVLNFSTTDQVSNANIIQ